MELYTQCTHKHTHNTARHDTQAVYVHFDSVFSTFYVHRVVSCIFRSQTYTYAFICTLLTSINQSINTVKIRCSLCAGAGIMLFLWIVTIATSPILAWIAIVPESNGFWGGVPAGIIPTYYVMCGLSAIFLGVGFALLDDFDRNIKDKCSRCCTSCGTDSPVEPSE